MRLGQPPQTHRAVLGLASSASDDTQTHADDDNEGDGDGNDDGNDDFTDPARLHVVQVTDEEHQSADVHLSDKTCCWARTKHIAYSVRTTFFRISGFVHLCQISVLT